MLAVSVLLIPLMEIINVRPHHYFSTREGPVHRNKFIVCEDELWQLLQVCSFCAAPAYVEKTEEKGTYLQVKQVNAYLVSYCIVHGNTLPLKMSTCLAKSTERNQRINILFKMPL